MRKILLGLAIVTVAVACNKSNTTSTSKDYQVGESDESKKSYASGFDLGKRIPQVISNLDELDKDMFAQGMKDAIKDTPQLSTEEQARYFEMIQNEAMTKRAKEMSEKGKNNLDAGKAFLAENKTKEGVKETASGLQYKIVKQGTGTSPKATDKVEVHYQGTLIDGTEFDSSYKRGKTISFPLNGVIKGWTEGLQLVKEGGEIMLYIPSELGYGANGAGAQIGPNSTLIFKVELIKVNP